ncbi:MAG: aldo/keto reductase [Spirochaetes bacterium]|nr:aldo/keto reductase [Spirochaetota bacterium]MBN2770701.1 aldo/keto reductase [Spirochaetota bacterium]
MITHALGNTGKTLSQYVLGTMLMGTALDETESFTVLDDYVRKGGNFLDTANCYAWWMGKGEYCGDESENIIGKWHTSRNNRSDLFIATKVGARITDNNAIRNKDGVPKWGEFVPRDYFEGASGKVITQALEDSLQRLKTDYVDLLYVHVDDRNTPLEETLETLNGFVQKGKVKHIGYSNIQTWRLEQVFNLCRTNNWVLPVAIQQEYSYINPAKYGDQGYINHAKEDFFDWLNYHREISLVAYSPLLKGIFTNREKADALLSSDEYNTRLTRNRLALIDKIAKEQAIHPNALVLAWMAAQAEGIFPLLGFSNTEQYYENCEAFNLELDDEILLQLKH